MSLVILRGDALDVAQIAIHTVAGTPAAGQQYTLTCNSKAVSYVALNTDTNTTIASALVLLLSAASQIKEIQEATFTSALGVITSRSATPGMPYTFSTTATGTGTFVTAITQAASGHEHADDPTNWTLGRIPAGECAPPVQAAAVASTGGTLTDTGTFYWVVTATNALGETLKSNQQSLVIAAPNQTATLTWATVPGATGYKVYRSTTIGTYTTPALVATLGNVLTYIDTGTAVGAGAVPGANTALGDDVFLSQTATSLKYGLPTDYLVWNSLTIDVSYTGQGGLLDQNPSGYFEYRPTYLKVAPKKVFFGANSTAGGGSPLFRIDKGSLSSTGWEIYATGNAAGGLTALWIKGAHASDTYVLQQGSIGLDVNPGETAQFASMNIGYTTSPASDVQLIIGAGCTCGPIVQLGGVVSCASNVAALEMVSGGQGKFYLNGAATMGNATIDGGVYYPKTTGAHTNVSVNNGGTLDHSQDIRPFNIIGTLTLSDGCTFLDPSGSITESNPIVLNGNLKNMTTDFGTNRTFTFDS